MATVPFLLFAPYLTTLNNLCEDSKIHQKSKLAYCFDRFDLRNRYSKELMYYGCNMKRAVEYFDGSFHLE